MMGADFERGTAGKGDLLTRSETVIGFSPDRSQSGKRQWSERSREKIVGQREKIVEGEEKDGMPQKTP